MESKKKQIGLWRGLPVIFPGKTDDKIKQNVFPSARQSLTYSLSLLELKRGDYVALPDWSSHCVISAVGAIATPIPLKEVLRYNIETKAILIYEQWGWMFPSEIKDNLSNIFSDSLIVYDRVDSADIDNESRTKFYPTNTQIDLVSLSKILGLSGGGFARINGEYVKRRDDDSDRLFASYLDKIPTKFYNKVSAIYKNEIRFLSPHINSWLNHNNLLEALKSEQAARKRNLNLIINSSLSRNWPKWMFQVADLGSLPGIVPLFFDDEKLEQIKNLILQKNNIETQLLHFNRSGNPFKTEYVKCIALPIHGLVLVEDVINVLEKIK